MAPEWQAVVKSTEKPLELFPGKQSGGKLHVHGIAALAMDRHCLAGHMRDRLYLDAA
jgi:hypothetical protein